LQRIAEGIIVKTWTDNVVEYKGGDESSTLFSNSNSEKEDERKDEDGFSPTDLG